MTVRFSFESSLQDAPPATLTREPLEAPVQLQIRLGRHPLIQAGRLGKQTDPTAQVVAGHG